MFIFAVVPECRISTRTTWKCIQPPGRQSEILCFLWSMQSYFGKPCLTPFLKHYWVCIHTYSFLFHNMCVNMSLRRPTFLSLSTFRNKNHHWNLSMNLNGPLWQPTDCLTLVVVMGKSLINNEKWIVRKPLALNASSFLRRK